MVRALGNVALVVASITMFFAVGEFVVFPRVAHLIPLRFHHFLGDARPLAQSSKRGTLPQGDWILLVGDSHANGNGDWLLDADPDANGPFHSAHVIHAQSGRDVMSFGVSGVGSARGFAAGPAQLTAVLRLSARYRFRDPAVIVAYFYAGNDVDNNLSALEQQFGPLNPSDGRLSEAALDAFLHDLARPPKIGGLRPAWTHNLYFSRLFDKMAEDLFKTGPAPTLGDSPRLGRVNRAVVGGQAVFLPDGLQGPSLERTEAEVRLALVLAARSLAFLKGLFPEAATVLAYLPAPLEVYHLVGPRVSAQSYAKRKSLFELPELRARSDGLCRAVRAIAVDRDTGFLDLRPALAEATTTGPIHGPRDWKHPNEKGYRVIGAAVAAFIEEHPARRETCGTGGGDPAGERAMEARSGS